MLNGAFAMGLELVVAGRELVGFWCDVGGSRLAEDVT